MRHRPYAYEEAISALRAASCAHALHAQHWYLATDFCADLSCNWRDRRRKVATCVRTALMHLLLLAISKPLRGDVSEVDFPYSVAATSMARAANRLTRVRGNVAML